MLIFTSFCKSVTCNSPMVVRVRPYRRQSTEELMSSNCGAGRTPENPWNSKIKLVNLKENQPWTLLGKTDAEAETPVFWSSDANSWLTGKVPDAGKDWGQKQKSRSEDEMAGWHHDAMNMKLGKLREMVRDREAWRMAVHEVWRSRTRLGSWTTVALFLLLTFLPFM